MIPATWITIGSDILTVVIAVLIGVDDAFKLSLLSSPIIVSVLSILGAVGIVSHIAATTTTTTKTP